MWSAGLQRFWRPVWSATVASREEEEGTLQTLYEFRAVIDGVITEHHGRVFDSADECVIPEFASPVAPPRRLKA